MNTQASTNTHSMYGTGTEMVEGQSIDEWAKAADLEFKYETNPVQFDSWQNHDAKYEGHYLPVMANFAGKRVIYRSDTKQPLSIVSDGFQIVQPTEILGFFRNLVDDMGFVIVAAGSLKHGNNIWALARTGNSFNLGGEDEVGQYVLLSSAIDAKKATRAVLTSIRPSCSNMFEYVYKKEVESTIRITHNQKFSKEEVQHRLGLVEDSWTAFRLRAEKMATCILRDARADEAIIAIFGDMDAPVDKQPNQRAMNRVRALYHGDAKGYGATTHKTAWGLLNAVTEYVDHHAGERVRGNRQASAWMGAGNNIKRRAQDLIMEVLV